MKKIFYILAGFLVILIFPQFVHAALLLSDDFTGSTVSSSNWHIPTWAGNGDGTWIGQTQFRCTQNAQLPSASSSNAIINVETYNPTGFSFYGTDLISNQSFALGQGLDITVRAKINNTTPGIVGGIFLYALKSDGVNHDEIDFELLGNSPNQFNTNIYGNEPGGVGRPQYISYSAGSISDYHIYEIKWLPSQVSWFVDGNLVRTETNNVPTGPMNMHINMWVPDSSWTQAYSANLKAVSSPSLNQIFSMYVDSVNIQSTLSNHPPVGTFEAVSANGTATGWTVDPDLPGTPINVDVYIDGTTATGTFLNEITANAPSPDVTAAYPAYTGNHRFIYTIPSKYQDGKQHTLYMYAIDPAGGTYPLLSGSPIAFTMTAANHVPVGTFEAVLANGAAIGWTVDPDVPGTPINVDVYIDGTTATGTFLNEITANAPSPDVTAAYPAYTGNHRFIYTIPSKYQDGKQHTLYMYAIDPAGGTYPLLSGSPIAFTMIGTPGVIITSVPKIGEIGVASGTVSGILSSNYSKYAVALYINVSATAGSWWIKPTFATPLTIIQPDGTWSASVTTGGDDVNASEIRAYLVPSDFSVPLCGGDATIPSSLDPFPYYRVTRATIKTFTISPSTVNLTVGGATKQLTATVIDQNNNPVTAPIRWYSSDYSIATVDYYSGIVTPVAAGQTSIYGLIGLKMSNYSAITVSP